jgi:hypothetical protein
MDDGNEIRNLREHTMLTNTKNIVLVDGAWAAGSSWSKEIPILKNSGYQVIAVQLAEHSLADDVETLKRAVEHIGEPTILVGPHMVDGSHYD